MRIEKEFADLPIGAEFHWNPRDTITTYVKDGHCSFKAKGSQRTDTIANRNHTVYVDPPRVLTFSEPVTEPPKRDLCMAVNPSNPLQAIIISKNERGYHPFRMFRDEAAAQDFVTRYNERHGLTLEQAEAWLVGSMFGWDCPGARDT